MVFCSAFRGQWGHTELVSSTYCSFPDGTLGVKSTPDKNTGGTAAGDHRLEYPSETEGYGNSERLGILVQFITVWEIPAKDLCPLLHIQNRQYEHRYTNADRLQICRRCTATEYF